MVWHYSKLPSKVTESSKLGYNPISIRFSDYGRYSVFLLASNIAK